MLSWRLLWNGYRRLLIMRLPVGIRVMLRLRLRRHLRVPLVASILVILVVFVVRHSILVYVCPSMMPMGRSLLPSCARLPAHVLKSCRVRDGVRLRIPRLWVWLFAVAHQPRRVEFLTSRSPPSFELFHLPTHSRTTATNGTEAQKRLL